MSELDEDAMYLPLSARASGAWFPTAAHESSRSRDYDGGQSDSELR